MENNLIDKKVAKKQKIIFLVIGILVGAVLATAAFLIYTKATENSNTSSETHSQQAPMSGNAPGSDNESSDSSDNNSQGTPPEKPDGDDSQSGQGGTPPEKPDGDDGGTPPAKPSN